MLQMDLRGCARFARIHARQYYKVRYGESVGKAFRFAHRYTIIIIRRLAHI